MKQKTIQILGLVFALALASGNLHAGICSVGDRASVEWKGSWYPATVTKASDTQCYIHYSGYDHSWDEWVGVDRIRITGSSKATSAPTRKEGDAVQVLWKGTWYPAHVIGVNGSQIKIHYDGYDNSWDEWVGPNRYR